MWPKISKVVLLVTSNDQGSGDYVQSPDTCPLLVERLGSDCCLFYFLLRWNMCIYTLPETNITTWGMFLLVLFVQPSKKHIQEGLLKHSGINDEPTTLGFVLWWCEYVLPWNRQVNGNSHVCLNILLATFFEEFQQANQSYFPVISWRFKPRISWRQPTRKYLSWPVESHLCWGSLSNQEMAYTWWFRVTQLDPLLGLLSQWLTFWTFGDSIFSRENKVQTFFSGSIG